MLSTLLLTAAPLHQADAQQVGAQQAGAQQAGAQAGPVPAAPRKPDAGRRPATLTRSAPDDAEQVLVRGQGSAVSNALSEQRRGVGVSTVMSRTELERAPESNLSDILTRLAGLSAYSDMSEGQAATGENQYVTIRGLDSSYNAYSLNGERIAPGDPTTRAISFDTLAPYGINSIKVTKTPTADMDGDATGGAIDIRMPTAFDFQGPYRKVTVQGQLNDGAADIGTRDLGGNVQAEVAQRFGKDAAFGVYASGYYVDKNVAATAVSPNAAYAPEFSTQADVPSLADASRLATDNLKYDVFTTEIKRYGGVLSLDYQSEHQTLYFRGTYGQYDTTADDNQVSLRGSAAGYNSAGIYQATQAERGQYFETDDSAQLLTTQTIGGATDLGHWLFDYDVFNSYSVLASPDQVEASLYPPSQVGGPFGVVIANTTLPHATGSAAQQAALYDEDSDRFWKTQGRDSQSTADMYGIHLDATYRFHDPIFDSIKFGVKASDTDRLAWQHPFFHDDNNFVYEGPYFGGANYGASEAVGPLVGALPGQQINVFNGVAGPFRLLSRSFVTSQAVPYKYANDPNGAGNYTTNDWNANTSTGSEKVYAGYAMMSLHIGPVHIYPGFREEWTDFSGSHWLSNGNGATGSFVTVGQSYGEPVPVLNVDWRPTPMSVLRFSARRSFTRPAFGLVNGSTQISVDPLTNQITGVSEPNPNLQPSTATNLDVSAELYNHHSGVVSASAYYKKISKFIFTSVSGATNSSTLGGNVPTGSYESNGTLVSMPENGGNASLEGLELNTEQVLTFLPGLFSGFGVSGNMTLQHSDANPLLTGHPDTELPRAPRLAYNLGIFYAGNRFRADVNYTYTGTQLLSLNATLPDFYLQPTQRLDFTARYDLPYGLSFSLAMQNLLNTPVFWETEGKSKSYLAYDSSANGAYVLTGRTFLAGVSENF